MATIMQSFYSVNSLLISHSTGDSFSSLIRVLFSEPLSPNQILKKWSIVENHTGDLCQTKLLVCPIGKLAFKQRVIERGNPFKFAHKPLTKFVKGVLQSCQICWHFSLSLLEKGLHPSFIYSWFKELLFLAN